MDTVKNMGSGRVSLHTRPREMRGQSKAFAWSVGIHLIVFMLVFGVMMETTPVRKTLIIDFSLGDQPEAKQAAQPFSKTESKSETEGVHQPFPNKIAEQPASSEKNVVMQQAPQAERVTGTENQVKAATPEPSQRPSPNAGAGAPRYGNGYGSSSSPSFSGLGNGMERPEMKYVKAHFSAIRNAIISKLSYPRLARRMGWTGTVKVSFVVNEDGGVSNVKVLETSGVEVLDNNALETISRGSPYPKPPCKAEIVMPITYRLD
jgi:periplasmic protein TonB